MAGAEGVAAIFHKSPSPVGVRLRAGISAGWG
jgi:hypothetical protein